MNSVYELITLPRLATFHQLFKANVSQTTVYTQINNRGINYPASEMQHVRRSCYRLIPGHIATLMIFPRPSRLAVAKNYKMAAKMQQWTSFKFPFMYLSQIIVGILNLLSCFYYPCLVCVTTLISQSLWDQNICQPCTNIYIYIYIYKRFMVLTSSLGELMEDQILQYY